MHDLLLVRARQAGGDLRPDLERAGRRELLTCQQVAQLVAADQLHRDEREPVGFADLVNDGDVRMLDRRGGLGLLDEAPAPIAVVRQVVGQDLERDIAVQPRVGGAIDHAHPAAADFFGNPIVAERAAGEIHALGETLTGEY